MENEDPTKLTGLHRYSVIGIVLSIVGIVLPICLLLGIYPFVEHGRSVKDQEVVLASLCSVINLTLELIAIIYGLAARRTVAGKVAVGTSGILLCPSILIFAFVLTTVLDRAFGWADTPFWLIIVCIPLAISLLLFSLSRVKWLH